MATIFLGNESYIVGSSREQKPTVDIGGAVEKAFERMSEEHFKNRIVNLTE